MEVRSVARLAERSVGERRRDPHAGDEFVLVERVDLAAVRRLGADDVRRDDGSGRQRSDAVRGHGVEGLVVYAVRG